MIVMMFGGFFAIKAANRDRKREYITEKALAGEPGTSLRSPDKAKLAGHISAANKGPRPMSPIESLFHNWSRQFDKKS